MKDVGRKGGSPTPLSEKNCSPTDGRTRLLWRAVGQHIGCGCTVLHYACHIEPNQQVIRPNQIFIGTHFAGGHRSTPRQSNRDTSRPTNLLDEGKTVLRFRFFWKQLTGWALEGSAAMFHCCANDRFIVYSCTKDRKHTSIHCNHLLATTAAADF